MKNLSVPEPENSRVKKEPHPSRMIMSSEELVEWVMVFLTSQHLSDEEMSDEVYFSIPHMEE
ncbi:hypothetical protein [Bacillus sp. AK031]